MNSKIAILFVTLAVCFAVEARDMTGSLTDTLRIVTRVCLRCDIVTDEVAKEFFACYDQAPGKAQFVKCQTDSLGFPMDSKDHIKAGCRNVLTGLPKYASCLKTEMAAAGVDQDDAVAKVNACQGKALKLSK